MKFYTPKLTESELDKVQEEVMGTSGVGLKTPTMENAMVLPIKQCVDAKLKESLLFPTRFRGFTGLVINDSNFTGGCDI